MTEIRTYRDKLHAAFPDQQGAGGFDKITKESCGAAIDNGLASAFALWQRLLVDAGDT
jgi:hypothetical protein